jgi:outer membrane protein assembly factor BamB
MNLATPAALLTVVAVATPAGEAVDPRTQWGQWRGPLGTGVAPGADPPVSWSETKNIRWKTALPGTGHSTPVVWGDRIFVTTAVDAGGAAPGAFREADGAHDNVPPTRPQQWVLLAVSRRDGSILWQRTLRTALPHDSRHETGTWASSSPVTDGRHVIAFFGSYGIYGLDVDGNLLWEVDLGDMRVKHGHGEGASPALSGDTLIVNWDHDGESFVVALDKSSGTERWRVPRDEQTLWSTPIVV